MPYDDGLCRGTSDWNLDRLHLEQSAQPYLPGLKNLVPLQQELAPVRSIRFGEGGATLVLYDQQTEIYSVDRRGRHASVLSLAGHHGIVDFAVVDRDTYLLAAEQATVIIRSSGSSSDAAIHLPANLAPAARLVAQSTKYPMVFIGPTTDGRIIAFQVKSDRRDPNIRLITVIDATGQVVHLESGIDFCIEPRSSSASDRLALLIPDTNRNRVLEVEASSGRVIRTFGDSSAPDGAFPDLTLRNPTAVAVYRPEGSILKDFLNSSSKTIVDFGDRSLPRTILVAERSSGRILKLIEMPKTIQLPTNWRGGAHIPLIGTGQPPLDEQEEFVSAPDDNLSRIAICSPLGLQLSSRGELLIQTNSRYFFILLTPQTAIPQNIEYRTSKPFNEGES